MKKEAKLRVPRSKLLAIVLIMNVLFASGSLTLRAQTSSVPVSQPSATPVNQDEALRAACQDAINELKAARNLLKSQGALIEKQNELLDLENKLSTGLKNLRTLDAEEKDQLRRAITAAERQVAALEAEVVVLKKNQMTIFKQAKYVFIGIVGGVVLYAVFGRK